MPILGTNILIEMVATLLVLVRNVGRLDKLLEVMDSYRYEGEESGARDICLVDSQTLELYSLQEHYIAHYIRDYYVQVDGRDGEELEVTGIYTPVLENGERTTDVAMESENEYN